LRATGETMLRPDATIERLHTRQVGTLPEHFGLQVTEIAEGRLAAQLGLQPWMMAPNGYLHAASVILLADTCAGYATVAHLPDGAKGFTTIELKSNFFSTAREGVMRCEATAEHLGRTTQVWSSTVYGPDGRRMALFRCTQMIPW
jgi:1,4-dihydroxy-2-naphthoyl-CoA hydrolase